MGQIYFLIVILKNAEIQLKKWKETVAFLQAQSDLRLCHSFWFLVPIESQVLLPQEWRVSQ